jgi:hypothetical protein
MTPLSVRAQRYVHGTAKIASCVPLAAWGQANDWLLYDPIGATRADMPGYVLVLETDKLPLDDLAHALRWLEQIARDILGTN